MKDSTRPTNLVRRLAAVRPKFSLIIEIENEIAPLPVLARRLKLKAWSASEMVTLVQMILQHKGETHDWAELAEKMTQQGFESFVPPVLRVLQCALDGSNKE